MDLIIPYLQFSDNLFMTNETKLILLGFISHVQAKIIRTRKMQVRRPKGVLNKHKAFVSRAARAIAAALVNNT